jgi:hypothetical protein
MQDIIRYVISYLHICWPLWNICDTNDHGYVPLVVNNSRSFPRSWLITGFVTRLTSRVSLVEQELLTLPEHPRSYPGFSGVRVTRSLVLYVCFVDCCLFFCTFLLAIVLSVLRYTDSDYPFGIFKLFFLGYYQVCYFVLTEGSKCKRRILSGTLFPPYRR